MKKQSNQNAKEPISSQELQKLKQENYLKAANLKDSFKQRIAEDKTQTAFNVR